MVPHAPERGRVMGGREGEGGKGGEERGREIEMERWREGEGGKVRREGKREGRKKGAWD